MMGPIDTFPVSPGPLKLFGAAVIAWTALKLPETLHPEDRTPISPGAILGAFRTALTDRVAMGYTIARNPMSYAIAAVHALLKHNATWTGAADPGHDGMAVQAISDIAMLFVRCREGISHHPAEYSTPEQLAHGAQVLLEALEKRPHDINMSAYIPHSALRVFVMGARGANRETATRAFVFERIVSGVSPDKSTNRRYASAAFRAYSRRSLGAAFLYASSAS